MPPWGEKPALPTHPSDLVAAVYKALKTRDYGTLRYLCHDDFLFSSNAHPEKLDSPVQMVGTGTVPAYLELVQANWLVSKNEPGAPKPVSTEIWEVREGGYLYSVTVQVRMQNRKSKLEFEGTKRQEWQIRDGKVSAMSQFLDCKQIDSMK
jgi:ketosteroid isomerase-like protein